MGKNCENFRENGKRDTPFYYFFSKTKGVILSPNIVEQSVPVRMRHRHPGERSVLEFHHELRLFLCANFAISPRYFSEIVDNPRTEFPVFFVLVVIEISFCSAHCNQEPLALGLFIGYIK